MDVDAPPPAPAPPRRGVVALALAALLGAVVGGGVGGLVGGAVATRLDPPTGAAPAVDPAIRSDVGLAAVAAAVRPSVVRVDVRGIGVGDAGLGVSGNASGIVWDGAGHVVTNHHVVAGATEITVATDDGRVLPADLVGSDPTSDIALIRVGDLDRPPIALADRPAAVGDLAVVIGSPYGLDGSVSAGIISAVDRPVDLRTAEGTVRLPGVLQTDAGVSPGNSGGPLVGGDGRLLGVTSAVLGDGVGGPVGFAVPGPLAADVVEQLREDGEVTTPVLGLAGTDVAGQVAVQLGVPAGVVVERVQGGGPADLAGVQPGDVLVAVDGRPLTTVDELLLAVRRAGVGATIELALRRDGRALGVMATLAPAGP